MSKRRQEFDESPVDTGDKEAVSAEEESDEEDRPLGGAIDKSGKAGEKRKKRRRFTFDAEKDLGLLHAIDEIKPFKRRNGWSLVAKSLREKKDWPATSVNTSRRFKRYLKPQYTKLKEQAKKLTGRRTLPPQDKEFLDVMESIIATEGDEMDEEHTGGHAEGEEDIVRAVSQSRGRRGVSVPAAAIPEARLSTLPNLVDTTSLKDVVNELLQESKDIKEQLEENRRRVLLEEKRLAEEKARRDFEQRRHEELMEIERKRLEEEKSRWEFEKKLRQEEHRALMDAISEFVKHRSEKQ